MPYYEYTPEDSVNSQPEKLVMLAPDEKALQDERYLLLGLALSLYFEDEMSAEDVETVKDIEPANLPVNLMSRLMNHIEAEVIDTETGLYVEPGHTEEDEASFTVGAYKFEASAGADITDDQIFQHLVIKNEFTHYAYQSEPLADGTTRSHYSLGYMPEDGVYQPVVTVLDARHPISADVFNLRQRDGLRVAPPPPGPPPAEIAHHETGKTSFMYR